jgi:hypothetical protein
LIVPEWEVILCKRGEVECMLSHPFRKERGLDGAPGNMRRMKRRSGLVFCYPTLAAKSAARMGHPACLRKGDCAGCMLVGIEMAGVGTACGR